MRFSLILLAALSSPFAATANAAETRDATTTATAVLLKADPLLDWTTPAATAKIAKLTGDINTVFGAVLTDAGKALFYQTLPFMPGEVLAGFDTATAAQIDAALTPAGELDLDHGTTGLPLFEAVLRAYHAKTLKKIFAETYTVTFDPQFNPRAVAKALTGHVEAGLKYAEADEYIGFGGTSLDILDGQPEVFVFGLGWGDCMAGCIANHRIYFEAAGRPGLTPRKIGETGDPLADDGAETYAKAFKP